MGENYTIYDIVIWTYWSIVIYFLFLKLFFWIKLQVPSWNEDKKNGCTLPC